MARSTLGIAVLGLVISVSALAGCAMSDASTKPQTRQDPAPISAPPTGIAYAYGDFLHHFETLEQMATVDVVIAKVVGARDGDAAPQGDGQHGSKEVRRVITVEVTHTLAGEVPSRTFDIQTLGWIVEDGKKRPLTFSGMPWLQIGDEAVLALDDPNDLGTPGFASEAAVQVFTDGRIAAAPVPEGEVAPLLSQELESMSKAEVIEAFAAIGP